MDKLSFLRIVDVCEKLLAVNDPFGFRLLVMEISNDVVNVVGLALVEKHLAVSFNKADNEIIDQYTCYFGRWLSNGGKEFQSYSEFRRCRGHTICCYLQPNKSYLWASLQNEPRELIFQWKKELHQCRERSGMNKMRSRETGERGERKKRKKRR